MMTPVNPDEIIEYLRNHFQGLDIRRSNKEISIFYVPDDHSNGCYFASIKDHDGRTDVSSELDRENIYRFSIRLPDDRFKELYGALPRSAVEGGVLHAAHDADQIDILHPHPKFAHLAWVCVLSPSLQTFQNILPLIREAYDLAVIKSKKLV